MKEQKTAIRKNILTHRIGYGGGYYDAFLSEQKTGYFIAGAYPFQMLDPVPKEAHDRAVHEVVLPVL